jgi:ABC-type glycerol-3-phosphate transport system substrate-binding protein
VSVSINVARASRKLENDWVITRRLISSILLACMAGLGLAACGSSSSSTTPAASPSSPAASPAASASSAASGDAKVIAANWAAFFNAKTPVATRVGLLQDGSDFSSIIKSQAGSGLASQATAQVTKVTVITSSEAQVTYSILISGTPELKNQNGTAVYEDGTWKVGVISFCGLLTLENGGSTSSLPAACKSAT